MVLFLSCYRQGLTIRLSVEEQDELLSQKHLSFVKLAAKSRDINLLNAVIQD